MATADNTCFWNVMASLDDETASWASHALKKTEPSKKFTTFKSLLNATFSHSKWMHAQRILFP